MIEMLASSMRSLTQRHEILANNLANASTPGYKADGFVLSSPHGASANAAGWAVAASEDAPGSGWTDFSPAAIRRTERELDVAIDGSGFLVVQTPRGLRYTRGGALSVRPDGTLVNPAGFPVLGERGQITLRSAKTEITNEGEVQDDGQTVDQLRIVDFPKPYQLRKDSTGLLAPPRGAGDPTPATDFHVVAGALEDSNVGSVRTMVQMIELLRSYESAQRAIQAADEADRYVSNDMGRV